MSNRRMGKGGRKGKRRMRRRGKKERRKGEGRDEDMVMIIMKKKLIKQEERIQHVLVSKTLLAFPQRRASHRCKNEITREAPTSGTTSGRRGGPGAGRQ